MLQAARDHSSDYSSETTRKNLVTAFKKAFHGLEPYDWQLDVTEAILLGLDCVVIAGTGSGKTMPFAMPLLVDKTKKKMVIVISPLNDLEEDQASIHTVWYVPTDCPEKNRKVYVDRLHVVEYQMNTLRQRLIIERLAKIFITVKKRVPSLVWA